MGRRWGWMLLVCCSCADGPRGDGGTTPAQDAGLLTDAGSSARDGGVVDANVQDAGTVVGTGICDGLPCLVEVASDDEFQQLSAEPDDTTRCDIDRFITFVLPRTSGTAIDQPIFVAAHAVPRLFPWLRASFSALATLSPEQYFRTFERNDVSEYYVGQIFRMRRASGGFAYGFSVLNMGFWGGMLTQSDVEGIAADLSERFAMPLGYAPQQLQTVDAAERFTNPGIEVHLREPCATERCPDPTAHCLVIPEGRTACNRFSDNLDIAEEHQNLARVELIATSINYPTTPGTYPMTLVAGGNFGPDGRRYDRNSAGEMVVTEYGGGRGLSFDYTQTLRAGPDEVVVQLYESGSNDYPARAVMREPEWSARESWGVVAFGGDRWTQIASCAYSTLPRFYGHAELGGGDEVVFELRYDVPGGGSGPFRITWAEVTLEGRTVEVLGFFNLVYAGLHHNFDNQLWLLFDAPLTYRGHDVFGVAIDEAVIGCCPVDGIFTLDENLQRLDDLDVVTYERAPVSF